MIEFRNAGRLAGRRGHGDHEREHADARHDDAWERPGRTVGCAGTIPGDRRLRDGRRMADEGRVERARRPGLGELRRNRAMKGHAPSAWPLACPGRARSGGRCRRRREPQAGHRTRAGARARARAARADVEIARGMRLQADLRANPTCHSSAVRSRAGPTPPPTSASSGRSSCFRRRRASRRRGCGVSVAEHEEADVRRQLAGDVAAAYGEVAAAARELAITDDVLAAIRSSSKLLRARAAQGATPTLDRDMVDVECEGSRPSESCRPDVSTGRSLRLKRLLGMPPETPFRVTQSLEDLVAGEASHP